jgi:phenylacetate-CoA ligase
LAGHLEAPFQLLLDHATDGLERLRLRCDREPSDTHARLQSYTTLATLLRNGLICLEVERCNPMQFSKNKHSGKIPELIDARR